MSLRQVNLVGCNCCECDAEGSDPLGDQVRAALAVGIDPADIEIHLEMAGNGGQCEIKLFDGVKYTENRTATQCAGNLRLWENTPESLPFIQDRDGEYLSDFGAKCATGTAIDPVGGENFHPPALRLLHEDEKLMVWWACATPDLVPPVFSVRQIGACRQNFGDNPIGTQVVVYKDAAFPSMIVMHDNALSDFGEQPGPFAVLAGRVASGVFVNDPDQCEKFSSFMNIHPSSLVAFTAFFPCDNLEGVPNTTVTTNAVYDGIPDPDCVESPYLHPARAAYPLGTVRDIENATATVVFGPFTVPPKSFPRNVPDTFSDLGGVMSYVGSSPIRQGRNPQNAAFAYTHIFEEPVFLEPIIQEKFLAGLNWESDPYPSEFPYGSNNTNGVIAQLELKRTDIPQLDINGNPDPANQTTLKMFYRFCGARLGTSHVPDCLEFNENPFFSSPGVFQCDDVQNQGQRSITILGYEHTPLFVWLFNLDTEAFEPFSSNGARLGEGRNDGVLVTEEIFPEIEGFSFIPSTGAGDGGLGWFKFIEVAETSQIREHGNMDLLDCSGCRAHKAGQFHVRGRSALAMPFCDADRRSEIHIETPTCAVNVFQFQSVSSFFLESDDSRTPLQDKIDELTPPP